MIPTNTFSLFFFLLFLPLVHSKNHCPISHCPNNTLPIQYPFKLPHQHTQNCSYTHLKCSDQGIPILDLPNNGEFYVRDIDYTYSIIKLSDPQSCLPKRFMNFNPSSLYPRYLIWFSLDYTFYSCPSDLIALSDFPLIGCLSNSTTSTVATHTVSIEVMTKLYRCSPIVTSNVPVTFDPPDFISNQSEFSMRLLPPVCATCPLPKTGFLPRPMLGLAYITISFLTVIMPSIICLGCCVNFITLFRKEATTSNSNVT